MFQTQNFAISLKPHPSCEKSLMANALVLAFVLMVAVGSSRAQNFVTYDQFRRAITSNGYPTPTHGQYNNFNRYARQTGSVSSKQEAAMALAQILHESGGLRYRRELACVRTGCPNSYKHRACDVPGQNYYGRGYIQLTWCYNYRDASQAIFGNPRVLLNDPDRVAREDSLSWQTAFWYWRTRVRSRPGVLQGKFGESTRAINGGECRPGNQAKAARFRIYGKVRSAFGLSGAGDPSGC